MVKVTTPRLGGGKPLEQFYVAGYDRGHEAERAVKSHFMTAGSLDEIVVAERELSREEIQALKLTELEVRQYV
jgi:hypothetical protein